MCYLFRTPGSLADVFAILQPSKDLLDDELLFFCLLLLETLAALARLLFLVFEGLFDELNVFEPELFADDVKVASGVYISLDMDNLRIVETPHYLEDGVDSADVRQESVAKTRSG